jgi:hypothetical protein
MLLYMYHTSSQLFLTGQKTQKLGGKELHPGTFGPLDDTF